MIHKIKAMYDNGNGASIKAISRALSISRNTVRKYLRLDAEEIEVALSGERHKHLDEYRDYLVSLLVQYPELKAPKIYRKLKAKVPDLPVSERSLRRYLEQLRPTLTGTNQRRYEPIIDDVPGVQCQVDGGELRDVLVGGVNRTLYFLVFVLSFSRLMYISTSLRPINTDRFIQMHDEAFRFFGGVPEECVYDQTKLVVIDETFREVELNNRFKQFALHHGFYVHACEGFDPESKGKVEAGVKYGKGDCFCGEQFIDAASIQTHALNWLDEVANVRMHGTTRQVPRELFEHRERACLKPYQAYVPDTERLTRKADKTGLISYQANRYSVPLAYQRARVVIEPTAHELRILDAITGEELARHTLVAGKGQIVKNTHHYRDVNVVIADRETELIALTGIYGQPLCDLLKHTSPKIYKDQLAGVIKLLKQSEPVSTDLLERLIARSSLTATQVRDYLQAYARQPTAFAEAPSAHHPAPAGLLSGYGGLHERRACV
ncbi:MAG: IS21 family transposase [Kordiimonadaceae bacterium]|nr:IS21 family transposase [Kordiimonadaceae bacterium]